MLVRGEFGCLAFSPDRKRLACVVQKRNVWMPLRTPGDRYTVSVLDPATGRREPLSGSAGLAGRDISPVWSADGGQLAWVRNHVPARTCRLLIYDLGKERVRTFPLPDAEGWGGQAIVWAPDGKQVACVTRAQGRGACRLSVLSLADGAVRELLDSRQELSCLAWQR